MINSLKGYQAVDSYWYDKVPYHWKKTKNKYVFSQNKHVVGEDWERLTLLTMGKSGVKPRDMDGGGKFPASFENYQTVEPNQLIFCLFDLDETPRTIGISKDYGMITSAYDVFSTTKDNDPKFWTYFYQMIDDHKGLRPFYTGLRKVVRSETFMGIEVFSPPLEEQKLISRYLDKKSVQIDLLIKKIQKKIELLKEKRTTLINQCVTKGLDTDVEMKDSCVDWIGDIPKHWKKSRVKYKCILKTGNSLNENQKEMYSSDSNDKIPYISSKNIDLDKRFINYNTGIKLPLNEPGFAISPKGSFLIVVEGGSTGKKIGYQDRDVYYVNKLCSIFNLDKTKFLYYYFQSKIIKSFFEKSITGLIGGVSVNNIGNFFLPLPDPKEQQIISDYLDNKTNSLDLLISKSQRKVDLLKEYMKTKISHIVTGKIRITKDMI
jgi:type I restriction enzyme S subunit